MTEILNTLHSFFTDYQKLEIIGTVVGLIYIYQEYKASIWLWLTGIVMPIIYLVVYYEAQLYADFGMQVYYIIAGLYGFLYWKFSNKEKQKKLAITHLPRRYLIPLIVIFIALWFVLYTVLVHFTNSNVPLYDSFGNAVSILGLWALSKKYIEQWLFWIIADIELAVLYAYKDIPFTAGLYALYVILAIIGYRKWKAEYHKNKKEKII